MIKIIFDNLLIQENELEHYGVPGMRWGIRNFQDYPSGSKRKGIYLGDKKGARPLSYKSKAMDFVKQFGVQTAKQVLAMLVPGAALVMNAKTISDIHKYSLDGKNYILSDGDIEKLSKIKKKKTKTSSLDDAKKVNPFKKKTGGVNNCMYCTATYEMRRRGYDVQARRKGCGASTSKYSEWFENVDYKQSYIPKEMGESRKSWVIKNYNKLVESIEKLPDGARGFCAFNYEGMKNGHTISWEVSNGSVTFFDGQSGDTNVDECLSFSDQKYTWARLDDRKIKQDIAETCISRKED